uniref:MYND-type domain-containing protein n=1 Tax=Mimivirus LCMiAC02 TaxID=2506609 RepID=A0A481Z179_9VIRU|nr:MAG: uncharacterized protein LCMiAC02_00040 [Mimivirus LCMiAC02]
MKKFNIAIIKPNEFLFDKTQTSSLSQIKQYIELKEITQDIMMETIIDVLNIPSNIISETSMSYEDNEYVYQISHIKKDANYNANHNDDKHTNIIDDKVNGLASYLVKGREEIYGTAILLCFKIMDNNQCEAHTIKLDDIDKLLFKKVVHIGLKVTPDGNNGDVEEYTFMEDPLHLEEGKISDCKNCKRVELSVLNFNLIVIICSKPKHNIINKKATILFGDKKIHGTVYIALLETDNIYSSITKEMFNKLLTVLSIPMYCRKLRGYELKDRQELNNIPIVMNSHCILEKRYNTYEHVCEECRKEFNKKSKIYRCKYCFRMLYCSIKCKKDDWYTHIHDCLYNAKIYNKLI